MNTDEIFKRYWDALGSEEMTVQTEGALVRFALRLAISEAYDAGAARRNDMAAISARQTQQPRDQRQAEMDRAQLNMLNEWLANEELALYRDPRTDTAQAIIAALRQRDDQISGLQQEIARMDADNADLAAKLQNATRAWQSAAADADRLALRIAQQPAATNGNGAPLAAPTPTAAAWFANLDDETNDWRISLEAGRRTFRQVPKASRLLLAQAVARSIGRGALPMQQEFDAHKPDWMPGGGGLAQPPSTEQPVADVVEVHGAPAAAPAAPGKHPEHDELFELSECFSFAIRECNRWGNLTGEHTAIMEAQRGLRRLVERTQQIMADYETDKPQ